MAKLFKTIYVFLIIGAVILSGSLIAAVEDVPPSQKVAKKTFEALYVDFDADLVIENSVYNPELADYIYSSSETREFKEKCDDYASHVDGLIKEVKEVYDIGYLEDMLFDFSEASIYSSYDSSFYTKLEAFGIPEPLQSKVDELRIIDVKITLVTSDKYKEEYLLFFS